MRALPEAVLLDVEGTTTAISFVADELLSQETSLAEAGYRDGTLRAHVFDDVPDALERWQAMGVRVAIFSSLDVRAQELFFAHSVHGDLTGTIDVYFDTTTGPKHERRTYEEIAAALDVPAADVLCLSAVPAELDAARQAGMQTGLVVRPGNPKTETKAHPRYRDFVGLSS